jgi:hypothetical protein
MLVTLVEFIKSHAEAHYEDGGWDVIVECWDDNAIAEFIAGATTPDEALECFGPLIDVWSDRQADARNSAF